MVLEKDNFEKEHLKNNKTGKGDLKMDNSEKDKFEK